MSDKSLSIEQRSFQIIDAEVGQHEYSQSEWNIVRRVIHSTADFDFAGKNRIIFRNEPISSALKAIERKCAIVADVDMVVSGINKNSIKSLGLKVSCHISKESVIENSIKSNKTRAQLAMRYASSEINGGIVIVGNAPSSLLEVIDMVQGECFDPCTHNWYTSWICLCIGIENRSTWVRCSFNKQYRKKRRKFSCCVNN